LFHLHEFIDQSLSVEKRASTSRPGALRMVFLDMTSVATSCRHDVVWDIREVGVALDVIDMMPPSVTRELSRLGN
jgi:hypothetical protein